MKKKTNRPPGSVGGKPTVKLKYQISEVISAAMEAQGITPKDLAEKLEVVYETARQYQKGIQIPADHMLKPLADALGEDVDKLRELAVLDHIRKDHGDIPLKISGKNPELEPIDRVWPHLSSEHKQDIIAMAQTYARRDREATK